MISPTVKRRVKTILLWMEITFILVLGAGMGIVLGAFYQLNKGLPPDRAIENYRAPVGTKIISSDGVVLAKLAAEDREPVPLESIPKHMRDAMVAIEDSRFYQHSGLDFRGLARAVWANLTDRELSQGASTITQQLARNMFLSQRKKLSRKIKELLLAVQIERNWTKNRILEAYLNQVYFGSGAYGVKSAAKVYFRKDIKDITLEEAAMLAALPQRPSELSPYASMRENGNYDRTKHRRDMVLDRMAQLKFITLEEAEAAKKKPIKVAKEKPQSLGFFKAKYAAQYVLEQLRDRYNYDEDVINKAGLTVVTSINWKMQQAAEKAAREELAKLRGRRISEVALVCLDPHTGYIRAMVGGVQEPWEKYQFNCVTQAHRQPGSSFKLFVYAAAFEKLNKDPNSQVNLTARGVRMPDGKWYQPKNHGRLSGSSSYTRAFALSSNGAAFNVCMDVGPRSVADMARRLGIKSRLLAYPSIALGVNEVTPLEMASAYGVFAAGGKLAEPMVILQVRDQDGEILEDMRPNIKPTGLKQETIDYINTLTRAVVTSGTGTAARAVPDAHGKTGTSEEYTDAWFVGYTPDLVTAVWAGNRDNSQMSRVYGGTIGAPIWTRFMKEAVELNPAKKKKPLVVEKPQRRRERRREEPKPEPVEPSAFTGDANARNVLRVTVCSETGMLARDACPSSHTEEYMLGDLPARCTLHDGTESKPAKKETKKESTGQGAGTDEPKPEEQ
jgi:penicillin-binding protein 1A